MKKVIAFFIALLSINHALFAQQTPQTNSHLINIPLAGVLEATKDLAHTIQSVKSSVPLEEKISVNIQKVLEESVNLIIGVPVTGTERIDHPTAEKLTATLPQAYDFLLTLLAYKKNPSIAANILAGATERIKDQLPEQTKIVLTDISKLVTTITQSNDPVDQQAVKALEEILNLLLCVQQSEETCQHLGIIPQMLNIIQGKNIPQGTTATDVLMTFDITDATRRLQSNIRRKMPALNNLISKYIKPDNPAGVTLQTLFTNANKVTTDQIKQVEELEKKLMSNLQ